MENSNISQKLDKLKPSLMKWVIMIAILVGIIIFSIYTSTSQMFSSDGLVRVASVVDVPNGKMFEGNIENYPPIIGKDILITIKGIDVPMPNGACEAEQVLANKARAFTKEHLEKAKVIELSNLERGKTFSIVADVLLDGASLRLRLIDAKLALPHQENRAYNPWCP